MYKMTHEIKNQLGNHIEDKYIRDEIIFAIEQDMGHTYYEGIRIDITKHEVDPDGNKITLVEVEL